MRLVGSAAGAECSAILADGLAGAGNSQESAPSNCIDGIQGVYCAVLDESDSMLSGGLLSHNSSPPCNFPPDQPEPSLLVRAVLGCQ